MSGSNELIVEFEDGIAEGVARATVETAGGRVRRRMRSDSPSLVMLLVEVQAELKAVEQKLQSARGVRRIERNSGDYRLAD